MKLFLLLNQTNLTFYSDKSQPQQLSLPTEAVKHQEIINQKLFEEYLRKNFKNIPKQEVTLFLSNELVFSKSIKLQTETIIEDELKEFVDMVPISHIAIETKTIQIKDTLLLLATNGDIYKTIVAIAGEQGCIIKKIVPLNIFGLPKGQSPSYEIFSRMEKEHAILKEGDFLQQEKQKKAKQPVKVKQVIMLITSLLILGGAIWWAIITLGLLPNNKITTKTVITPSPKPTLQATPSASPSSSAQTIKKEDIKIQILNGSGVAGQAGKIKDQLTEIGFTDIQTGNAEGPTSNTTIVIFSKKVSKEYQEAILAELKKTLKNIDTQEIPDSSKYDISITTGEVK